MSERGWALSWDAPAIQQSSKTIAHKFGSNKCELSLHNQACRSSFNSTLPTTSEFKFQCQTLPAIPSRSVVPLPQGCCRKLSGRHRNRGSCGRLPVTVVAAGAGAPTGTPRRSSPQRQRVGTAVASTRQLPSAAGTRWIPKQ